jgi:hypothetical protein
MNMMIYFEKGLVEMRIRKTEKVVTMRARRFGDGLTIIGEASRANLVHLLLISEIFRTRAGQRGFRRLLGGGVG